MKKLLFILVCFGIYQGLTGQEIPRVTNKIFIENVHVHVKPDMESTVGNVLIEDGIIVQVGSNVNAPFDAKVIQGDSMHVYAGFIAPISQIGLEKPKESNERPKVGRTGYPPNDVAGITPEKSISDHHKSDDRSISEFRKTGFTIAHTVPYGRMLPGKGSVISLSGKSFTDAVISQDNSLFATWRTANGVFPGTLIGIMSKWRELYRNAELANDHTKAYEKNKKNKKRPDHDEATAALFPVVEGDIPVYFKAEKHRDIARTLQLQKDLGFSLVIAEARDVDRILDPIKKSGAKVLLSLDLPEKEKEKKKKETKEEKSDDAESGEEESDEEENAEKDLKLENLKARKSAAIERYTGQAKMLSENGVPVSFSYLETKSKDVLPNLRRLVKDGLSEDDALAALTTNAAEVLGISDVAGSLEAGKMGNMVVSTGPIFDEKSKIKMVLVDGYIHEYEVKEKKKKSESDEEPVDLSGIWDYSIEVPGMVLSGTMNFIKSDDSYDVEITSSQNPGESINAGGVEVDGSNVTMSYSPPMGGANIVIEMDLTFDGDQFDGSVEAGQFGTFEIEGQKNTPE